MPRSFQVVNSFIEGETQAKSVLPLRINYMKVAFSAFLGIISFGIVIVAIFWSPIIRRHLMFRTSSTIVLASHFLVSNSDKTKTLAKKQQVWIETREGKFQEAIGFVSRYLTYYFCETTATFRAVEFPLESSMDILKVHSKPLSTSRFAGAKNVYGRCKVRVRVPSKVELFFKEIFHPFFVFQTYSCLLWIYENYEVFALFIWAASTITSIWNVIEIQQNYKDLKKMAERKGMSEVEVKRSKMRRFSDFSGGIFARKPQREEKDEEFSTSRFDIFPGDIIKLRSNMPVPCDCILLTGKAIVNESKLTGETQQVIKLPFPKENPHFSYSKTDKTITLFEGTYIHQVECVTVTENGESKEELPEALVLRTGFTTLKGQLIRSIIYPKPYKFKFRIESYKFLGLMFVFVSIGYLLLLPSIFSFNNSLDLTVMWLDLITIAVPPSLPAAMNMATIYSIHRLKKQKIFCISPPKMVMSGRVDTCIFDKTGTLTEESMNPNGFLVSKSGRFVPHIHSSQSQGENSSEELQKCLEVIGLCHSVQNAKNMSFGDPMESQLLSFSGFTFISNEKNQRILKTCSTPGNESKASKYFVERIIPFDSKSRRMSAVVKLIHSEATREAECIEGSIHYLMKGAPETLEKLCVASSLPENYNRTLEEAASHGHRVIALAYKVLQEPIGPEVPNTQVKEQFDNEMVFCGFFLFSNLIKEKTAETIKQLQDSNISLKVASGDNLLTTVYVAKESGIISKSKSERDLITIDLTHVNSQPHLAQPPKSFLSFIRSLEDSEKIESTKMLSSREGDDCSLISYPDSFKDSKKEILAQIELREESTILDESTTEILHENSAKTLSKKHLLPNKQSPFKVFGVRRGIADALNEFQDPKYEFLFTGRAFEMLYREFHKSTGFQGQVFSNLVRRAKIFARMSPHQKALLITCLQKKGASCAMIGDGANDTAALKEADVGIALSNAEASVSAPFSSTEFNISCIYKLLLEGRCSLSTNYQCFKFMVMYSMIEFTSVLILYFYDGTLSENQLIYIDMLIVTPLFALMPIIGPADVLSGKVPPQSLFSLTCFASVFGQIFLQAAAQLLILVLMSQQKFYVPATKKVGKDDWDSLTECQETSMIYLYSNLLYLCVLAVYMTSKPYRKPWYSNGYFAVMYGFYWGWGLVMMAYPSAVPGFLEIVDGIPEWWRLFSIGFLLIFFGLMAVWEKLIISVISEFDEKQREKRNLREFGVPIQPR